MISVSHPAQSGQVFSAVSVLSSTIVHPPDHQSQQYRIPSCPGRQSSSKQGFRMWSTRWMAPGMSKLCNRSSTSGYLARQSGQCFGANEIRNCPRIWPGPPRVPKHLGPKALNWLADLYTRMIWEQWIPKIWKQMKIIALVNSGKDPHLAASYPPISLLSIFYKLLECTVLQRISATMENLLSVDQATLRPSHSPQNFFC